jgi:hypothetical protein
MWISLGIDLVQAHAMVTEFNANEYMPIAPTNIFELAHALFNADVIDDLNVEIFYNHESEYSVNIVTTPTTPKKMPSGTDTIANTQDTPEPDASPTTLENIHTTSDVLTPDTHEKEMGFTKIDGNVKHSAKMKTVQPPQPQSTPVKNSFDKLSVNNDIEDNLDDDEPECLINENSDDDSSVSMIATQPEEIPTRGSRGKTSKTPTKKYVPDKDLTLITQMIAEGRAE